MRFSWSQAVLYLAVTAISLAFLMPFAYTVTLSFKTEREIATGSNFLPQKPTVDNYRYIVTKNNSFGANYRTSIIITVASVTMTLALSSMAGFAFARLPFWGSDGVLAFILMILALPLAVMLIPIFIMGTRLGLMNTYLGLILPNVATNLPFAIFLLRGVFRSIPAELEEAAEMDGATLWQTFARVMLPLAVNGLVVVAIITFNNVWGEYTLAKVLTTVEEALPLSVGLTLLKGQDWAKGIMAAVIGMAILPPVIIFILFQRRIVQDLARGAVKG